MIHSLTVPDFEETLMKEQWRAETRLLLSGHSRLRFAPNTGAPESPSAASAAGAAAAPPL